MKLSTDRILTTHTGSLPRPQPLIDLVLRKEKGDAIDAAAFETQAAKAVDDIVAQQIAAGIDVVSDGEMSKPSYTTYIRHRVAGIAPDPRAAEKGRDIMIGRDLLAHPDFANRRRNFSDTPFPGCVGPLSYKDRGPLERDLAHLALAAGKRKPADVFMTAPSPGILTRFIINLHYPTEDAYVEALASVLRDRIPGDRQRRLRAADRLPRPRLVPQQPVPRSHRRPVPQDRRAQHRGAQRRDRGHARRQDAAAHLLGQLRGAAQLRPAAAQDHRHRLQGTAAGDQHRGRQSAPRPRVGRPRRRSRSPTTRF